MIHTLSIDRAGALPLKEGCGILLEVHDVELAMQLVSGIVSFKPCVVSIIGPGAEQVHDSIDQENIRTGFPHIVTIWEETITPDAKSSFEDFELPANWPTTDCFNSVGFHIVVGRTPNREVCK